MIFRRKSLEHGGFVPAEGPFIEEQRGLVDKASGMHFAGRGSEPWLSADVFLKLLRHIETLDSIIADLRAENDALNTQLEAMPSSVSEPQNR